MSVDVLNDRSKFNAPKDDAEFSMLSEYCRGTCVKINNEWYLVIRDGKSAILMDKNFTLVHMDGNTGVQSSGFVTLNITEY